jgi:hypothetical protein
MSYAMEATTQVVVGCILAHCAFVDIRGSCPELKSASEETPLICMLGLDAAGMAWKGVSAFVSRKWTKVHPEQV